MRWTSLVSALLCLEMACRPAAENCCEADAECSSGALCFEGMCASRCLADSQCAVGEICVEKGACAAPSRGPSPCAFSWRTGARDERDAGIPASDAADGSDAGSDTDAGWGPFICEADDLEPNDSTFDAVPWLGELDLLTICSEDRDYFLINAARGEEIGARIEFQHRQGDLDLALLFAGRTLAVSMDTSDTEEIRHRVEESGAYVFEVYGFGSEVENRYQLYTYRNPVPCEADPFEENDTADEAVPIAADAMIEASLCPTDTSDFFLLDVEEQSTQIAVTLSYDAPPAMRLSVLTPQGQNLFSESGSGEERIGFSVEQSGAHLVQVSGFVPEGEVRTYRLQAETLVPPCGDEFEPNDTPALATPIMLPVLLDGVICPADFDYFSLNVPEDRTSIRITTEGPDVFGSVLRQGSFELLGIWDGASALELPVNTSEDRALVLLVGSNAVGTDSRAYQLAIE